MRAYRGTLGIGPVEVAGILIPSAHFQIVHSVCVGGTCDPKFAGEPLNVGAGIFGVGATDGFADIRSLMGQLPGNLGSGFIVSLSNTASPTVTVGITPANSTGFKTVKFATRLQVQGIPYPHAVDWLPWCYTIPQTGLQNACVPGGVVSDTGGLQMVLDFGRMPAPRLFPIDGTLGPGITVIAKLGDITWSFETGTCFHFNRVDVQFQGAPSPALATNGTAPFFSNDVMYDLRDGLFGFRPTNAAPPPFCTT